MPENIRHINVILVLHFYPVSCSSMPSLFIACHVITNDDDNVCSGVDNVNIRQFFVILFLFEGFSFS
jgi:hypothetical protein